MIGWFLERVNSLTRCHLLLLTVISSPWYPRAVGQSAPVLLLRNQTSVVTFHPLNNQLFLSLCLLEKQLFKRTMKQIFSTKIQNKQTHTKKKRRSVKEWRDWVSTSSFLKILYIFAQFLMFLLIVVFLFVFFFLKTVLYAVKTK